eukprot:6180584-Pleurochrysis_carterae.AAC.2
MGQSIEGDRMACEHRRSSLLMLCRMMLIAVALNLSPDDRCAVIHRLHLCADCWAQRPSLRRSKQSNRFCGLLQRSSTSSPYRLSSPTR